MGDEVVFYTMNCWNDSLYLPYETVEKQLSSDQKRRMGKLDLDIQRDALSLE